MRRERRPLQHWRLGLEPWRVRPGGEAPEGKNGCTRRGADRRHEFSEPEKCPDPVRGSGTPGRCSHSRACAIALGRCSGWVMKDECALICSICIIYAGAAAVRCACMLPLPSSKDPPTLA
eukprot:scaffold12353_cov119-Isochrysis_galbana.AAC.5